MSGGPAGGNTSRNGLINLANPIACSRNFRGINECEASASVFGRSTDPFLGNSRANLKIMAGQQFQ